MIYTVTISPAIDYVGHLDRLQKGATNRSTGEKYFLGGKGINVSQILKELGMESIVLGFVNGFTGKALENGLHQGEIKTDFIYPKQGITRINVKIKAGEETEINGQGTIADESDLKMLYDKLRKLQDGDVLIISGNIPAAVPQDTYSRLLEAVKEKDVLCIVDTNGAALMDVLKYHPFLIKPNMDELRDVFGEKISAEEGAEKLQKAGARNVIVSMGGDGAVLKAENGTLYTSGVCRGKMINSVGAGDSMVAGCVAGYLEKKDYQYALDLGSAAGAATAFSPGLAVRRQIYDCMDELRSRSLR